MGMIALPIPTWPSWKSLNYCVILRIDWRASTIILGRQMPKAEMHNMQKIIGIKHGGKGNVKDWLYEECISQVGIRQAGPPKSIKSFYLPKRNQYSAKNSSLGIPQERMHAVASLTDCFVKQSKVSFWGCNLPQNILWVNKKRNFDNKFIELILLDLTNVHTFYNISSDASNYSNRKIFLLDLWHFDLKVEF